MRAIHVINQFVWPDAAPTAVYAEQLADELTARGNQVRLVGTTGHYRTTARPTPKSELIRLPTPRLPRRMLAAVFVDYLAAQRCVAKYIRTAVEPGDVVVLSSAPPTTPWLLEAIRKRRAVAIYWLQDYYPDLIRSVWDPPAFLLDALRSAWNKKLSKWDAVLKIGGNLGYHGENAQTVRNWATFEFTEEERAAHPMKPGTALYFGNLGYAHDRDAFLLEARRLLDAGYQIRIQGDGPGMANLPHWIEFHNKNADVEELKKALLETEIHMVAAHPKFQQSLFPSKIWNSLEAGRKVVGTGFAGDMATELEQILATDHRKNRALAADAVEAIAARTGR